MAAGELSGRRIVLGVSGGIAAYKSAELTRLLGKAGAGVDVVLTEGGARFVTPVTFQALSGNYVWTDLWDPRRPANMAHIDLSRAADAVLVAPASADFLAKLVQGMADDLLTTLCLARPRAGIEGAERDCPLLVAPAMNRQMWENPATQRNIEQLRRDGISVLGPAAGDQACGEIGMGRMLEPEELLEEVVAFFQPKLLAGRRVLITAGPTQEALDPVRVITNLSSGRMGYALARAAQQAGADVTLVSGPVDLAAPRGVARVAVRSALDMHGAVMQRVHGQDFFIAVAAVADYRPAAAQGHKIKKSSAPLSVALAPNPDILAAVAALPDAPFCVGFAAESRNLDEYAEGKRRAKRLPMVVGNLVQDGLGGTDNSIVIYDEAGRHALERAPKEELARKIIAHAAACAGAWRERRGALPGA
ncbi:MAG: bifunctional phosphopantothenoylcysteine decarboxylase/phosphopantothenate--cysteine ligase CoaBC [Rhodocyclaceae bacterium]|nr:bifunctional phosphopantothenoylcysteine decarboxylase/phosphopantothenate--cysteine ligase CoaBC [Rhodocyclaceae bacterium]MBX3669295.1 bifunctional phosphopantothenoylcysteine decarboxylase/phosphopantothenate--cysteine ligase CoaBC [Rhodocyclaceae bacterium]